MPLHLGCHLSPTNGYLAMGNDALVEVAFDGVGTKKLMLRAAGSHLKKV